MGCHVHGRGTIWIMPELMDDVLELSRTFPVSRARIAADFGVTVDALAKWLAYATKARARAKRAEAAMLRRNGWSL